MAEFIAASAAVLMVPSIKGFKEKLNTALSTVDATVKVGISLDKAAVSKVEAEVEAFKKAAEKGSVKTQLELDVKKAEAQLTELRIKEQARKLGIKVEVDTKQADLQLQLLRAQAEARAIKMRLEVDTDGVKKEFDKLTNGLGEAGAGFKKALTLNLQVIGLSQLPAVGLALASVTQSMVALGQSALLLPGILSGVASSFATLLVGVSGIKAAFTAYGTAVKDSAQDAQRAKDATRALDNANRDLTTATRDAKRSLEDLNQQMRGQPLDEASAVLDLRDAQIQLADSFGKTGLQRQRDQIAEQRAQQNLDNVRVRGTRLVQDATQANKDGVAGNPAVLDALDRQAKAVEGLATASKGGTAIAEALKNLSPNAQDFVTKVESMRGSWTDFKKSVSDKLFAGLGDDVVALGSKLPVVEKGFSGIASALNNNVKTALKTLSSDQNVGFFDRIFGNTADAQGKLSGALKPLIDGFVHLGAVGSDFLPRMVDGFAHLLDRFNNFIDAADKDGRLKTWIETGIQAAKDLGNSFLNIVSIVGSVAEAFTGSGGQGFLGSLETGTKRLADFLKSADGQDKLQKFFHDARESFNEWLPIIKDIVVAIKNAFQAGKDWSDQLRPFLSGTASLLKDHAGLAQGILTAYLGWKTISPVIKTLKALLDSDLLGALKKVIAAVGEGEGFKGKLGALSGFMSGAFTTAAAGLALFVANNFVTAFNEGEGALSRMKTKADELRASLDQVTGAADSASAAAVSFGLQHANNSVTGENFGDLRQVAKDRNIDTGQLSRAVASGDSQTVDSLLAPTKQVTRKAVEGSEFYQSHKDSLQSIGGLDTLVNALNGDPAALQKYSDWADKNAKLGSGKGLDANAGIFPTTGLSHEQVRVAELSHIADVPDLQQVKQSLSPDVQAGINLTGDVNKKLADSNAGRAGIQATNRDAHGTATLNAVGKGLFGANASVQVTDAGGVAILVPGKISDKLRSDITANHGDIKDTFNGTQVTLDKDRAKLYANLPAFKTGGRVNPNHGGGNFNPGIAIDTSTTSIAPPGDKNRLMLGDILKSIPGAYGPNDKFPSHEDKRLHSRGMWGFAEGGGMLSGPGSGTSDSILARVSNGEFITRADQVAKNPGLFHGLNSGAIDPGSLPRFDGGGLASVSGRAQPPEPIIRPNGFLGGKRASFGDSWNQIKTGATGAWDWFRNAKTSDIGGADKWSLTGGVLGLDRIAGGSPPAGPAALDNKGPGYNLNPFDAANATAQFPTGASQAQHRGVTAGSPFKDSAGNSWVPGKGFIDGAGNEVKHNADGSVVGSGPVTAPPSGPTGTDLFGGPAASGPSHLDPTYAGPGPAGIPAGPGAPAPLPAEQGYVPTTGLPADGADPNGFATQHPFLASLFGLGGGSSGSGGNGSNGSGPPNPLSFLGDFGKIVLNAILGFFGLSSTYLSDGKGLVSGIVNSKRHGADPTAQSILDNQPAVDAATVPLTGQQTTFSSAPVTFTPGAGAAQWSDEVDKALAQFGPGQGIPASAYPAWHAAIIRQIQTESGGNPGADNPNDTNGKGGSQHVSGLLQYLPSTFAANNIAGTSYLDPYGQIAGVLHRAPRNADGTPSTTAAAAIGQGHGWASGGMLSGPGTGTSDSILARVSHGEFITKASQVAKNPGLFHGLNSGAIDPRSLPAFAVGGEAGGGLADVKRNPDGSIPTKSKGGGSWTPPKTVQPLPSVAKGERAAIGAAPQEKHTLGAVDQGIDGAATAIGNAASMAASAATMGMGGGGAMGSLIGGATQIGAGLAKGIANIGSSLLVGTVTGGTTAGAYGSPVLPQKSQQEPQGPRIVNQYGDIHTASYDEFYKGQQRREQQQQAPYINSLRK